MTLSTNIIQEFNGMAAGELPKLGFLCSDYLSSTGFMCLVVSIKTGLRGILYGVTIQSPLAYIHSFHTLQLCC